MDLNYQLMTHATMPRYQTDGASGLDLHLSEDLFLNPRSVSIGQTGVRVEIPSGYEGQVRSRGGLAANKGIFILNSPGTVDSDYRGEIMVIVANLSDEYRRFKRGDRIAQLVICPVVKVTLVPVSKFSSTARDEGRFGSTGTQ